MGELVSGGGDFGDPAPKAIRILVGEKKRLTGVRLHLEDVP